MRNRALWIGLPTTILAAAIVVTLAFSAWLWDLAPVRELQALGGWLTPIMRGITLMGDDQFFLVMVPLFYWCINKSAGVDMGVLLLGSGFIFQTSKSLIKHARPFWSDARLALGGSTSFSLPSGHAQNSTALYGYMASRLPASANAARRSWRPLVAAALIALIVLVAFSRVYLGVHFPGDVLWGATLGLLWLSFYRWLRPRFTAWLATLPASRHALMALLAGALPLALTLLFLAIPFGDGPGFGGIYTEGQAAAMDDGATISGMVLGLWFGLWFEQRRVGFLVAGPLGRRVLRYVLGVLGLVAIWMGLRLVFPAEPVALGLALRVVRYALAMFWAIAAWPWLFVRLGLADTQRGPSAPGSARTPAAVAS